MTAVPILVAVTVIVAFTVAAIVAGLIVGATHVIDHPRTGEFVTAFVIVSGLIAVTASVMGAGALLSWLWGPA